MDGLMLFFREQYGSFSLETQGEESTFPLSDPVQHGSFPSFEIII